MMNNNVIPLRPNRPGRQICLSDAPMNEFSQQPFDQLTARLVLAKHERGELPAGIVTALLAAVGLAP